MNLEDDERVLEFFLSRDLNNITRRLYLHSLKCYTNITGLTPTELIREALDEYHQGIHISDQSLKKYLLQYKGWLLKQEYEDSTRKRMMGYIKTFYKEFEIQLPNVNIKTRPRPALTLEDLPTRDEIYQAILSSNLMYQAIILLMTSSGLASGDVRSLKFNDFLISIEEHYKPSKKYDVDVGQLIENLGDMEVVATWEGYRQKNRIPYLTFSTPESVRAILSYLKIHPPGSRDDFLFRTGGHQILPGTLYRYFERLTKKCGFPRVGSEGYLTSHQLRRRFASILIEYSVEYVKAEYMLGHRLPAVPGAYYKRPSREVMKEAYLKAMPHLCIIDEVEVREIETDDLKRLKELERKYKVVEKGLQRLGLFEELKKEMEK